MRERSKPGRTQPNPGDDASERPKTLEEALDRVTQHARAAGSEASAALQCLIDAATLAGAEVPEAVNAPWALLARFGAEVGELLARPWDPQSSSLAADLARALDEQIARWENRAQADPNARTVLRVFLAVRESLWELGVRAAPDAPVSDDRHQRELRSRRGQSGRERPMTARL